MLLNSLKLVNFRQFYGESTIEFSKDTDKNVTLIHAENGVGKTTLLNSILWCMFERLSPAFERQHELVCFEAKAEGVHKCRVEVSFSYEDKEYLAQRSYDESTRKSILKVWHIDEFNYRELPSPSSFINHILPKDMSGYFFFDGEGVSALNESHKGERFRRAIRDILGFTFAEKAIEDLSKIKLVYSKKASELEYRSEALKKAARKKADLDQTIYSLQEDLEKAKANLTNRRDELTQAELDLANSGHLDASRLQKSLTEISLRLETQKRRLKSIQRNRQLLISTYGFAVFGLDLSARGIDFIDESNFKGQIPAPYQETLIKDLLEQEECICGRDLIPSTESYEKVTSLIKSANTAIINQRIMKARAAADNMAGTANEFLEKITDVDRERDEVEKQIGNTEKQKDEREKELDSIKVESIKQLQELKRIKAAKKEEAVRHEVRISETLAREKVSLELAIRELNTLGGSSRELDKFATIQELIEKLIERCVSRLESYEEKARLEIAHSVNEILKRFSRKSYKVKVDPNFEFHLSRNDEGDIVAKSTGEKLLLNLAFVSALIDMARRRQSASGDFLISGAVAPFVIDAPFGELDETYKAATSEFLPGTTRQLVLFLSSSHWKGTVDQTIRSKIGSEYILVSERKSSRGEKPLDILRIMDHDHELSVYEVQRDITTVKRIL